jgi:hypothetical protein
MTEAATEEKKPKKKTPHIRLAAKNMDKQIKVLHESELDQDQKLRLIDLCVGIKIAMETFPARVADTSVEVDQNSLEGQLMGLGRGTRMLASALGGEDAGSVADKAGF